MTLAVLGVIASVLGVLYGIDSDNAALMVLGLIGFGVAISCVDDAQDKRNFDASLRLGGGFRAGASDEEKAA